MKINTFGLVFFLLVVAVGCASTPEADDRQVADEVQATDVAQVAEVGDEVVLDPNEIICKKIQKTGSRQSTKMCATRAQWEEAAANAKLMTEEMQARPNYGRPTN